MKLENYVNTLPRLYCRVREAEKAIKALEEVSESPSQQQVMSYSLLADGTTIGELAYVENSEGTFWLPGSLGGNYYPAGHYRWSGTNWISDRNALSSQLEENSRTHEIRVTQLNKDTTLGGVIDSSKIYILDGIINMGTTQITVPTGGINLKGGSFNVSGLVSTEDNYTMFVSETPVIGSGDVLGETYFVVVSGANSKVYDLYDVTGNNAVEIVRVNYINCTSLGDLHNYRQGLEEGTGRFGGTPTLTLHGVWVGGFRITTSIVRGLDAGMTTPLFAEGTTFTMQSRFLTDINADLPVNASLLDFSLNNFPNSSTLQIHGAEITKNGIYSPNNPTLTPNVSQSDLCSDWKGNNGLSNTFIGGVCTVVGEVTTVINVADTWYTLNGVWSGSDLQHFESTASGQLKHLGSTPREFEIALNLIVDGGVNDELSIQFKKWDASEGIFSELFSTTQTKPVNNFVGGRDTAGFFNLIRVTLDKDDYVFLEVKNVEDTTNVTVENNSFFRIQER